MDSFLLRAASRLALCLAPLGHLLAAPVLGVPAPLAASVGRYQKFELRVPVTGTVYTNAYDFTPSTGGALLRATFTAPSGAVKVVDGFYQEGYTLANATTGALATVPAANGWRVRFTPTETGTYAYSLTFQDGSGTSPAKTGTFSATASTDPGFVRRQAGKNYLRFDNNTSYLPVGENLGWGNNPRLANYKVWLDQLAANRANCIRLYMCYWGMELEWTNIGYGGFSGLKRYAQPSAYELDWIFDYCAQKGIYIDFALNNFGQVSAGGDYPQWAANPYNAANGGPCPTAQPWSFFSNATAKAIHKNKLRYLVSRYGYSKNLLSWELMNELDMMTNYGTASVRTAANAWLGEMGAYVKSIDPNQHLTTTSYGLSLGGDAAVWNSPSIDLIQTHCYEKRPDLEAKLAEASTTLRTAYNKPYVSGEFGLEIYHTAQQNTMLDDPNAIHFRTTLWSSLFNGSMGPGLTWWWDDYVHTRPTKTYPMIKAVRNFCDFNVNVVAHNYQPVTPELTTSSGATMTVVPGFAGFAPPTYAPTPAPASSFVVSNGGQLTPSAASLSTMLFGAFHASARRAPSFQVNFPVAGQVQVVTGARGASSTATLVIQRNGATLLTQVNPVNGTTYSISVPAGASTITLDNTGNEWLEIRSVSFTNYQAKLIGQALRDGEQMVGYVRNRDFTWQYYLDHNQTAPVAATGGVLTMRNLTPGGAYRYQAYNTLTGAATGAPLARTASAAGVVTVNLASLVGDVVFVLQPTPVNGGRPLGPDGATSTAPTAAAPLQMQVFPNPATDRDFATVVLDEPVAGSVTYELFDNLGARRWTLTDTETAAAAREQAIPLRGLAAGTYLLRASAGGQQRTTRLVVLP